MSKAVIWNKDVYERGFRCPMCGRKLFDPEARWFVDENVDREGRQFTFVFCKNCQQPVGYVEPDDGSLKDEWQYVTELG